MNLMQMSPALFAGGLAVLAGIVFLLQRLRVQHREVEVVTTMFWREALEEQRARTLVERFRHPLTYLLLLALAGLLWLGFARPDSVRSAGERHVLLLDGSAGMQREGRFDLAKAALAFEAKSAPRDRTEVLFCAEHVHTILAPGEDRALLASRLEGLVPSPVPSSVARALASATRERRADAATRIAVFGDSPIGEDTVSTLPEGVSVERAKLDPLSETSRGIVACGISPAASGEWSTLDAYVEVMDEGAMQRAELAADIDGKAVLDIKLIATKRGPRGRGPTTASYALPDIPAEGGLLTIRLGGNDSLQADNVAVLRLPNRPRIRVAVTGPSENNIALRSALSVDPAVELVTTASDADVIVGTAIKGRPALELTAADAQDEAILVGHSASVSSSEALQRAVGELGLDRVDAGTLAERIGRTIAVGAAPTAARRVSIWAELLDPEAGLVTSRAFPVLVGRAVRWLADVEPIVPYRATGRPVPNRLGDAAPTLDLASIRAGETSLIDRGLTAPSGAASIAPTALADSGPWRPYTWFLLLALIILGVEWVLFSRGRVA